MKLYDILRLAKDPYYEAIVLDTDFTYSVRVPSFKSGLAHDMNGEIFCAFVEELTKKVRVIDISRHNAFTVSWTKLIERNMDKFRAFSAENWVADLTEKDECMFTVQWIKYLDYCMTTVRSDEHFATMLEFVQSLDPVQ